MTNAQMAHLLLLTSFVLLMLAATIGVGLVVYVVALMFQGKDF